MLAAVLGVEVGDCVEVDLLEGQRRTVSRARSTALVEDYFGIRGMMDLRRSARLMREAPVMTRRAMSASTEQARLVLRAVKAHADRERRRLQARSLPELPRDAGAARHHDGQHLHGARRRHRVRRRLQQRANLAVGARRELASLRVLGFTRAEVLRILLLELALLTLIAQPPGWVMGYGLAWIMKTNLAGELMRVRLVVENSTYVLASAS